MILEYVLYILAGLGALAVVLTRDIKRQTLVLVYYGQILSILFVVLQAPDVAFSELLVGAALVPLMTLITIRKIERKSNE